MCICLLAPQKKLRIVYSSESVWLRPTAGNPEIVADLLVHNDSNEEISLLCCVVPQKLFNDDGSLPEPFSVQDITEDLIDPRSRFTRGAPYQQSEAGGRAHLKLTLPNPTDTTVDIIYDGIFVGGNSVRSMFSTPEQRALLNLRMFGVVAIDLGTPILSGEDRWLRLYIRPFSGPQEYRDRTASFWAHILNEINLTYHVSGPSKVRYDVAKNLANMRREVLAAPGTARAGDILTDLDIITQTLIENCTEHPGTEVVIRDWRTRFFQRPMDPFLSMQTEGAVRIAGAQPNFIDRNPREPYYEWTTGEIQVLAPPPKTDQGYFSIRFTTKYVPRLYKISALLSVLAFVLTLVSVALCIRCC